MVFTRERPETAVSNIAATIATALTDGKQVLWLVSGGSAISLQVSILEAIKRDASDNLSKLIILPVDERFGPYNHVDSNTAQLREAGFDPNPAQWSDILLQSPTLKEASSHYASQAEAAFAAAQLTIATLGLGTDAHTAGLLPYSPALADTVSSVVAYNWDDYVRMTMGVGLITRIDSAFVLAYGESKQTALERLLSATEPIEALPAKVLYEISNVTVYNDFVESEGHKQ
jgi:6-phosphogluconolactonase/glucosamine-6-phosphate isomerase/deaminase